MILKAGAAKIRVLLPVLGFVCFLVFQFLKSDDDAVTDVNTFLRTRLSKLVDAFDENHDGVLNNDEPALLMDYLLKVGVIPSVGQFIKYINKFTSQLLSWFYMVDMGDKANELKVTWEGADRDGDGHITLNEYLEQVGFLADDPSFVKATRRRFLSVDKDRNDMLSKEEFAIFLFPELSPEMTHTLYDEEMADRDANHDNHLSLHEYLGLSEAELADQGRQSTVQQHVDYFRAHLDTNHDDILNPDEVLAWVSDDKRHLRVKAEKVMQTVDKDRNGVLSIETEIISDVKYFSEHELTRYGDMLLYQDEL